MDSRNVQRLVRGLNQIFRGRELAGAESRKVAVAAQPHGTQGDVWLGQLGLGHTYLTGWSGHYGTGAYLGFWATQIGGWGSRSNEV